jgi:hypothetical protein
MENRPVVMLPCQMFSFQSQNYGLYPELISVELNNHIVTNNNISQIQFGASRI